MIDLLAVFKDMPEYAIMKIRDDFPEYTKGQDIDILCGDLEAVKLHLTRYFWDKVDFKVTDRSDTHIHCDILEGNEIDIRFDLYSEFISEKFTRDALQYTFCRIIFYDAYSVSNYHDLIIKCYEYLENGKRKYKDYAVYKSDLDAYR